MNRIFYNDANGAAIIFIGRADVAIDGNVLCKVGNINVTISHVDSETLLVDCDNTGVSGENAFGILAIKALSRLNQVSVYQ